MQMLKKFLKHFWVNKKKYLLVLISSLVWSLTMLKSGIKYNYGIGFWGPNGHDGVWHLSLARSLSQGSLRMPIFAGYDVSNYHLGFDILLAALHKVSGLRLSILYFQILPFAFAILIGSLLYSLLKLEKLELRVIFWVLFFVYFSGNFGWLVSFLRAGEFAGESMFWAQPNILTLVNPPYALSLIFILSGLIFLKKKSYFSILFFGFLIQIKAYAAIISLASLLIVAIYNLYFKKERYFLKIFVLSLFLNLLIFLPFNKEAGSLLVFKPFWFLETMMQFPDRLGWTKFGEAMVNYKLAGNLIKLIPAYLIAFLIFWYGNLGTRFLSEIYLIKLKKFKIVSDFDLFLITSIFTGLFVSLFFVQKGTAWNTIQFFYYSLFFSSILSGIVFAGILKQFTKKNFKLILLSGIFIFNLPTAFSVLKHYLPSTPPAYVSLLEIDALNFLEEQPNGIAALPPFDRKLGEYSPAPRPLYLYESTSYVSAFTGKQVFLEDEVNLDITGFNWQERRENLEKALMISDRDYFINNNIKYIYLPKIFKYKINLEKIFENEEIVIYKV